MKRNYLGAYGWQVGQFELQGLGSDRKDGTCGSQAVSVFWGQGGQDFQIRFRDV